MSGPPPELAGFHLIERPAAAGWRWPVYRRGQGPAVVLMHELFGLTDDLMQFANRVADAGFTVWLPVLSGPVPAGSRDQRGTLVRVCISREFNVFRWGRTSRVVTPLRELALHAAHVGADSKGAVPRVGVIGMCFSGGFALALAAQAPVLAAVAAQPSLPYPTPLTPWCARDLGLSPGDARDLGARLAEGAVEVYYTRFSRDEASPPQRARRLVERCGPRGVTLDEIESGPDSTAGIDSAAHSTLALAPAQYQDPDAAARLAQTAAAVVAFLHTRLD